MASFKNRKNILTFVVGLCLAAQAMFLLPHHHHGGDETPCLNVLHCIEAACGSGCNDGVACATSGHGADAHSHGAQDGQCSMNDIEQLRIDQDSLRGGQSFDFVQLLAVFTVGSDDDACGHCHLDNVLDLSMRRNRGVPPLHTDYIAQALPPRAPLLRLNTPDQLPDLAGRKY